MSANIRYLFTVADTELSENWQASRGISDSFKKYNIFSDIYLFFRNVISNVSSAVVYVD